MRHPAAPALCAERPRGGRRTGSHPVHPRACPCETPCVIQLPQLCAPERPRGGRRTGSHPVHPRACPCETPSSSSCPSSVPERPRGGRRTGSHPVHPRACPCETPPRHPAAPALCQSGHAVAVGRDRIPSIQEPVPVKRHPSSCPSVAMAVGHLVHPRACPCKTPPARALGPRGGRRTGSHPVHPRACPCKTPCVIQLPQLCAPERPLGSLEFDLQLRVEERGITGVRHTGRCEVVVAGEEL